MPPYKPLFIGASDNLVACPVSQRGMDAFDASLASRSAEKQMLREAPPAELAEKLLHHFSAFQVKAKAVHEQVESMRITVDTAYVQDMLLDYASGIASEISKARDKLRKSGGNMTDSAQDDQLSFCLAVIELITETMLNPSAVAPGLLRWYSRHYLEGEEDVSDWFREALDSVDDVMEKDSAFWANVCRLALADYKAEVQELLKGVAHQDPHIGEFCDFLSNIPSMRQMEQAGATAVEFRQVIAEMQAEAKQLQVPESHPLHELVCVYSGCSQAAFEANKDITWKFSRTWIEDFVFTHAWIFPDLRRSELGELLQAVTRRRQDDRVDQVDLAFMAALTSNVPRLLELLSSMPENFPQFFLVHLVDLLYYAGRLPVSSETPDGQLPIRDKHLMAYAEDLCRGKPLLWGYALNYLRAGGSTATGHFLETMADKYCASAVEDEQLLWKALNLLEELEMSELGRQHCWRRARLLRNSGDFLGALSWACWAVVGISPRKDMEQIAERGAADISEFCDEMGEHDMTALLAALAPANLEESFDDCPSPALLAALAPPAAPRPLPTLPASARLYFYIQYAHCHALQHARRPVASWAPVLVKLLSHGFAPANVQLYVLKEELATALDEDPCPFEAEEVLALMKIANVATLQSSTKCSNKELQDLHRSLGMCLSRAILQGSGRFGTGSVGGSPLLMA